jgi:hypothetical protein
MKVLITGSRNWVEPGPIERELRKYPPGTILVHGGARGVDNIAGAIGKQLGFIVRVYPANWELLGKRAGPARNATMLKEEHPDRSGVYIDRCLAYHEDPSLGKGTRHMVALVSKAQPPIIIEKFYR